MTITLPSYASNMFQAFLENSWRMPRETITGNICSFTSRPPCHSPQALHSVVPCNPWPPSRNIRRHPATRILRTSVLSSKDLPNPSPTGTISTPMPSSQPPLQNLQWYGIVIYWIVTCRVAGRPQSPLDCS
jgi:hypothetical protein